MACLVRYPGGKQNKGGYGTGKYYIRLRLPNLKNYKHIPTGTENTVIATKILKRVEEIESIRKVDEKVLVALYKDFKYDNAVIDDIEKELDIDRSLSIKQAGELYLKDCSKRVTNSTVKTYKLALRDLYNALRESTRLQELTKRDFGTILSYLKENYGGTTVNIRLRGIRAFLRWLDENDFIDKIPFKVKLIKLKERLPKFLTPEELQSIYKNCGDPIMVSIFKVYVGTGMRLSELKTSQLENNHLRVIGKGNKERLIPLSLSIVEDYQIAMAANYKTDRITKGFTKARRKAGISENKSLHALRHTFALMKLVELGEKHLVQELLGHSSVTVTEMYTKFPLDYLKEVFNAKLNNR